MAESGIAVSTRLMLVSRAIARLTELEKQLCEEIEKSERLDALLEGGYVYTPEDSGSPYDICLAIDALLAECLSLFEVIRSFTVRFCRRILHKKMSEEKFDALLIELGYGGEWLETLAQARNFFLHESAPWPAVQVHNREPLKCELVVLKSNVRDLTDPSTFISKRQLVEITRGLAAAVRGLHQWLSEAITQAEALE
jgi:hypothetical protein